MDHKVLVLKMGYSEVLVGDDNSRKVSLGDVLRNTVLLNLYKNEHVTWVTDEKSIPILEHNPLISRLLPYDLTTVLQLESEEFDTVINLERIPGICALADKITAWRRYGFRFNKRSGKAEAYDNSFEALAIGFDKNLKQGINKSFQELLFEMLDKKWQGEEYVLGYRPSTPECYDVGLNTLTGDKWPTKSWPKQNWDSLEQKLLADGLKVTRQDRQDSKILSNLDSYMDWINSSHSIISTDSLGLHLGIAFKKQILGLFGPTSTKEVYLYNRGEFVTPAIVPDCMPCFNSACQHQTSCMQNISADDVYKAFKNLSSNI